MCPFMALLSMQMEYMSYELPMVLLSDILFYLNFIPRRIQFIRCALSVVLLGLRL